MITYHSPSKPGVDTVVLSYGRKLGSEGLRDAGDSQSAAGLPSAGAGCSFWVFSKGNPEDNGYRLNGILGPDARLNAATLLQGKPSRLLSNRRAASGCPAVNWGEKQALPHRVIVRKK